MTKNRTVVINGARNKVTFLCKRNRKENKVNYSLTIEKQTTELDLSDAEAVLEKDFIYIYDCNNLDEFLYKEIYGFNTFQSIITGYNDIDKNSTIIINSIKELNNGIDFSTNNFESLKDLIYNSKFEILDHVLKVLLKLERNIIIM